MPRKTITTCFILARRAHVTNINTHIFYVILHNRVKGHNFSTLIICSEYSYSKVGKTMSF